MQFQIGDQVQLLMGGPTMEIMGEIGKCKLEIQSEELSSELMERYGAVYGDLICKWCIGEEFHYGPFANFMLKKVYS